MPENTEAEPADTQEGDADTDAIEQEEIAHEPHDLPPSIMGGYFDRLSARLREVWHPRRG